jgi:transposase
LFDVAPIAEVVTTQLQSNHHGRNSFPENLRKEEQVIYPEGIDTTTARQMGEDVTEVLAYKPCELFVKKLIRPKLMDIVTSRIYQAAAPDRSFEKSNADPSLIAQVIVEKYVDHLPLYRQFTTLFKTGSNHQR